MATRARNRHTGEGGMGQRRRPRPLPRPPCARAPARAGRAARPPHPAASGRRWLPSCTARRAQAHGSCSFRWRPGGSLGRAGGAPPVSPRGREGRCAPPSGARGSMWCRGARLPPNSCFSQSRAAAGSAAAPSCPRPALRRLQRRWGCSHCLFLQALCYTYLIY